jgi:hypothetical protein
MHHHHRLNRASWYHNPDGLYNGTNPLIRPLNQG